MKIYRQAILLVHLLFGLLLSLGLAVGTSAEILQLDAESVARAGVEIQALRELPMSDEIRVVGQVVRSPGATVEVKTILAGRVEAIHVAPGQAVDAGQILLEIHSHALHELQGELLRAHSALRLAKTRVESGRQLLELEGLSRLELEEREQKALGARLEVEAVEAELEDLGYRHGEIEALVDAAAPHPTLNIRAPEGGVVLELEVETHEWLEPYAPLVMIGHPQDLELHLQIPPQEASRVLQGDLVTFEPVGRPGVTARARVITPVPQIDPKTRTVTIRAELLDHVDDLLPGLFIEGVLACGEPETVLTIPSSAIIRVAGKDTAFVRRGVGTFDARDLELGRFDGQSYEVLSGLEAGEKVAVRGVFLLKSALLAGAGEGAGEGGGEER